MNAKKTLTDATRFVLTTREVLHVDVTADTDWRVT